jgi:hypothetical protein
MCLLSDGVLATTCTTECNTTYATTTTLLLLYVFTPNRYKKYDVFDTLRVPEKAKYDLQVANCSESCLAWSDLYLCLNFLDIVLTFLQVRQCAYVHIYIMKSVSSVM